MPEVAVSELETEGKENSPIQRFTRMILSSRPLLEKMRADNHKDYKTVLYLGKMILLENPNAVSPREEDAEQCVNLLENIAANYGIPLDQPEDLEVMREYFNKSLERASH